MVSLRLELKKIIFFVEMPSIPKDILVFRDEMCVSISFWSTRVKENDVIIRCVRYYLNAFLFSVFMLLASLGPIHTKNSLNWSHISFGSVIMLESTIILFSIFFRLLDLHIISDMYFHVAFMFFLFSSITSLEQFIVALRIVRFETTFETGRLLSASCNDHKSSGWDTADS